MNFLKQKNNLILFLFVALSLFVMFSFSNNNKADADSQTITYSEFIKNIDDGTFEKIIYTNGSYTATAEDSKGKKYTADIPSPSKLIEKAEEKNIVIDVKPIPKPSIFSGFFSIIVLCIPIFLLIGFWLWMMKKQKEDALNINSDMMSKVVKKKSMINPKDNKTRLSDVAGNDEAKAEVTEIIEFLRDGERFSRVGARSPRGVLMSGPPGTGKTLLAKAIAGEAGVPFFTASGSDFVEMYVGVGASRVRALFEEAKKNSPCIIFIDEIDAMGRARSNNSNNGGSEEKDQTLIQLLDQMDGFSSDTNITVIAASNRPEILDKALTRPGRFDREVTIALPDLKGRFDILNVHAKKVPVANDVNWMEIAKSTPGYSGADLANLVNEAAILSARENDILVYRKHFLEAADKILMGVSLGSLRNDREKSIVAYHEAGHAVVAQFTENSMPVHKISIMPRGRALGVTIQMPSEDSFNNHSYNRLLDDIAVLMGGRAAEEVALKEKTIGASNDFHRATILARRIVATFGMDDEIGIISIDGENGYDYAQTNIWSEEIKTKVDVKVRGILNEQYLRAKEIISNNYEVLDLTAKKLIEKETVEGNEFMEIVNLVEQKKIELNKEEVISI